MNNWMCPEQIPASAFLAEYRCVFTVDEPLTLRLRFSADERAQLFLDGKFLADGPEIGTPDYWYCAYAGSSLLPGEHLLTVRVTGFSGDWNYRQMSVHHGFFCEDSSGVLKNWQCRIAADIEYSTPFPDWGAPPRVKVGAGYGKNPWQPVRYFSDSRELHEPELPLMRREQVVPRQLRSGLYFFPEYGCRWSIWHWHGRGTAALRWSETPYLDENIDPVTLKGAKGRRDGSCFIGNYDTFSVDRDLTWVDFTWRAGHYLEVETAGDIHWEVEFYDTGYPLPRYRGTSPLAAAAVETLRACAHDTFMDCPYYERLLYAGDFRLEALALYRLTGDHRLAAKSLRLLLTSQQDDGSIVTQYPGKSHQVIPAYMPITILAAADYWKLHGFDGAMQDFAPRLRRLADYLMRCITPDGVIIPGWQFIDWVPSWPHGVALGNAPLALLTLLALRAMVEMFSEPVYAGGADALAAWCGRTFHDRAGGRFFDDREHTSLSEQTWALAVLAGFDSLPPVPAGAVSCSIYFSWYYLEACRRTGRKELLVQRVEKFRQLTEQGLTTLPEEFDHPRSDCHAWSSSILCFIDFEGSRSPGE